jgi:aminoglycoside N3'-acetyltransferase
MTPPGLKNLQDLVKDLVGVDKRPLVVFSAVWPLARVLKLSGRAATDGLLELFDKLSGADRLLAMPAFTGGYQAGLCDLDQEPSVTGVLTECFRKADGVRRTVSVFFPFSVRGPESADLVALRPRQAWGEGSFYDWCEREDVDFLMLGCHPTNCSYLHRAELLLADRIRYRYLKTISGRVRHEGREFDLAEELFVRMRNPEVVNDFTLLHPILLQNGMRTESFGGVPISAMRARTMMSATLTALTADPFLVVKNRQDFG